MLYTVNYGSSKKVVNLLWAIYDIKSITLRAVSETEMNKAGILAWVLHTYSTIHFIIKHTKVLIRIWMLTLINWVKIYMLTILQIHFPPSWIIANSKDWWHNLIIWVNSAAKYLSDDMIFKLRALLCVWY